MAAINTAAVSGWLKRTYAQKNYFKPYQNDMVPMLESLDECPDEAPEGFGWFVPLFLSSSQNWRAGAEGSVQADVVASTEVQGQVNAQEFKGTVQLTEFLKRAGSAKGHFNGGALAHQMKMITTDLMKAMQRFFVLGHGTGRLAIVDADVVAGNSFLARLPISIHGIGVNMRFDVVDLDVGGSVQAVSNRTINSIDRTSRGITGAGAVNTFAGTVTFSGAPGNITAGHGIYRSGDYGGNIANGIDGLVQDGTISSSFLGQTYAAFPGLKAARLHNSGTPRDISQDLMQQLADLIFHNGGTIESFRCNTGVYNAYGQLGTNDKRYQIVGGAMPKYVQGWREGDLLFAYDKVTATIKKDPQVPARTMYALNFKDSFYKHTLAEMGFLDKGGQDGVLHLTPNGVGFEYSWTALLYAASNISNYAPPFNGRIDDITDSGLAGD